MDLCHTFKLQEVEDACSLLISENAEVLIKYIYNNNNRSPYNDQKVRVGLVLKTLLKTSNPSVKIDQVTIEQVMDDLTNIISDTKDPVSKKIYMDELHFIRSFSVLDDLITLNTKLV